MSTSDTREGWSYAPAVCPIVHPAGTVPPRPLQAGDTIEWPPSPGGRYPARREAVLAVAPSLVLLVKPSGGLLVMHRAPLQGDNSRCITAVEQ